jgi:acetate kinase
VRKYGYHGTSHLYVSKRAAAMLGRAARDVNLITLHIGNGASAAAIRNGAAVDTSLGMTPLAGLTMGTRPGDLEPGIVSYGMQRLCLTPDQMQTHLNKQSGLLGLTECYADRRDVEENADKNDLCRLAMDVESTNVKKYIGGFMALLGHVDAIVFTAGVGEKDPLLREKMTAGLEELGIKLDPGKNAVATTLANAGESEISAPDSRVKIFMIPTNEELVLVEDTIAIMNGTYDPNHLDMDYSFAE